jgi:transposase-like protein
MGLCRNYHPTDELARDSLTCSKTHHTDQCQSAQTENINGTGTALTVETGDREGLTLSERAQMKELQRENRELRQANDILRKASAFFAAADLDRLRKR